MPKMPIGYRLDKSLISGNKDGGQGQNGLAALALRAHCVRLSALCASIELPTRRFSER